VGEDASARFRACFRKKEICNSLFQARRMLGEVVKRAVGRIAVDSLSHMRDGPHLLVVDDDFEIRDLLARLLGARGFRVSTAREEREMRRVLSTSRVDLIILDLMLPGKHGLTICREIRVSDSIPIIVLTAMGDSTDKVIGLEMGADDYVPKPFDVRELESRVRAVLRRTTTREHSSPREPALGVTFAGWKLDLRQRQLVSPEDTIVDLTSSEFDLLKEFAQRPQRVLGRDELIDLLRGREATPFDRSIDVQVSRLRRKIEADPRSPRLIKTVRGGGYFFTPQVERL
jgi:two-component system OmpR family response regulator